MATKTRSRRQLQDSSVLEPTILESPPVVISEESELTEFSYSMIEDEDTKNMLMNYEGEVRSIIHQSLENVVRLGEIFTTIKDSLLPYRQWKAWVTYTFKGELTLSTTHNWMNVYALYQRYSDKYEDALEQISLRDLYMLGRSGVEVEAKEVALELVNDKKVRARDAKSVIETYRKIKLVNAGVEPEVVKMLTKVDVAENPKYVRDIRKLSKTKQGEVAKVLASGEASTPRDALRFIKERDLEVPEVVVEQEPGAVGEIPVAPQVAVELTRSVVRLNNLSDVESESIQVALVESPLKFDYMESNQFFDLTKDVARVLIPGGFALITVGHKAAMFAGTSMHSDLKPVHLVCLRRQPGNTSTIIGLNIASASVFMVLAYKPPYRAPKGSLIADLHTLTDTEALPGADLVQTGLEKGFKHLLEPLLSSQPDEDSAVLHHVVPHSQHFSIGQYLEEITFDLGAKSFISVS